jgi:alkylation response protein AidB-like acyl-CoA dehydrogenase
VSTVTLSTPKAALLAKIQEIAPILQEDAAASAREGVLSARAQQAVIDSGLLGMCVPIDLGGSGLTGLEWLEVLEEITRVDAHTGWCVMALSSHGGLFSSGLSDDGVADLFGSGISRVAGMPAPRGRSRRVEGGVLHSGKHGFASGSSMCTHFVAGGIVHGDDGKPIIADNGLPEMLMVIVPRDEVKEQGNWDVNGMEATTSIDFELGPDLFVPDHRTLSLNPWKNDFPRGATYWRIGVDALGPAGHTPCALGMAHRALQEIATLAPTRKRIDIQFPTLADQPRFQHDLVKLDAELKSARVGFHHIMSAADAEVAESGGPVTPEMAHHIKQQVRVVHDVAVRCADFAYHNGGSTGFRDGHTISRLLRDLHTINTHVVVDPQVLNAAAPTVLQELQAGPATA